MHAFSKETAGFIGPPEKIFSEKSAPQSGKKQPHLKQQPNCYTRCDNDCQVGKLRPPFVPKCAAH